ncbi:A disintegrin and metalloproteinase with thrombospondin motifs 15-like [Osmerus eperlanus]|uniref:A disintegrin and metalloproteinase with thrombospondin motifs 15-like n=1 Tax=Osmerus eperlanus TaxID=29151 RepID=UPI002E0F0652
MSVFMRSLFLFMDVLLFAEFTSSMDVDICVPVRMDQLPGKHSGRGEERISDNEVVFRVSAFQQEFILSLRQDSHFLGPGIAPESGTSAPNSSELRSCFYSGDVNADRDSYVALSLCKGLQGAFSYGGMEYFISVNKNVTFSEHSTSFERTHVIRRRGRSESGNSPSSKCMVGPGSEFNISGSLEKYRHRGGPEGGGLSDNAPWSLSRSRRFASIPRFVEVLVVADESMAKFHGDDLKQYLLTLLSVAAQLYRHPSILNSINLVVVGFMVISEADKGPKVSSNAAVTLRNFCSWQKKINKHSDAHPEYWDTAILFTKQDLCGASTCDTLGMADVGTMCDPRRSCSVIEDDGLPSAFTTAHELGHVFNMPHDNVRACEDVFGRQRDNHMMSPTLIQISRHKPWSSCSAAIITDFLDRGHGDCLLDQPARHLSLPDSLPGRSYSLPRQCELAFGLASKPCPYMQPCSKLWCTGQARGQLVCQTRHFPWADGTGCGGDRVCYRGGCTHRNNTSQPKVDGRWGKWGGFGPCSRTCGGGAQLARRECDHPAPEHGGKFCQGLRIRYRSCNLEPCASRKGKTFREEQCEAFNGFSLNTNRLSSSVVWVPKYSGVSPKDKCKLICRANGTGYFYVLAPKVVDGTPCSPDTAALCVQGRCIKAGCDGKLSSSKKFDKCGVCGGDNQSCRRFSGIFSKPIHGYNFVAKLPVGATNIDVRQRGYRGLVNDDNYLALRDARGRYLLNGNYVVSAAERDVLVPGGLLRYSGTSISVETLRGTRPLQEALTLEVLSVGRMTPPRIRYSFYRPGEGRSKDERRGGGEEERSRNSVLMDSNQGGREREKEGGVERRVVGFWEAGGWGDCSVSCGSGVQHRAVQCQGPAGGPAPDCDPLLRPPGSRVCGGPCPLWEVGPWSLCSKSCGRGFKRRQLLCVTQTRMNLPREHCSGQRKPQELDLCNLGPCSSQGILS